MAQVRSLKLLGAAGDTLQNSQESSACQISQAKDDATKSAEQVPQHNSNAADGNGPEPDQMDDDVQLVLSVPRRRKKKRKRFNFFHSPLGQYQETQGFPKVAKEEPKGIDNSSRRKSTSVVQRLESCHLWEKEAGQRRGSLPAVSMSINAPVQLSWTHEPNFSHHQFPIFPLAMPWWEDSMPTLPHAQMSSSNWVPWQQEDAAGKKRKLEDGWQDSGPRKQYRQSTQLSPRSNPVSMIGSRFNAQQQASAGMAGTFDRPMPDHSTNVAWPSFDWELYRIVNPQYVSPYTQPMATDITDSNHSTMSQLQPSLQDWAQHTSIFSREFVPDQASCEMFSPNHSPAPEPIASPLRYSQQQCSPRSPLQQPRPVNRIQTPQLSAPLPSAGLTIPTPEPHLEINAAASGMTGSIPATPAAAQPNARGPKPSDILRRPKIPAWPPTPSAPAHDTSPGSSVVPRPNVNPKTNSPDLNRSLKVPVSTSSTTAQQLPNQAQDGRGSNAGPAGRVNEPISPSSPTSRDKPIPTFAKEFQIPRARVGRKHSPNW